jgi:hypothetical protein
MGLMRIRWVFLRVPLPYVGCLTCLNQYLTLCLHILTLRRKVQLRRKAQLRHLHQFSIVSHNETSYTTPVFCLEKYAKHTYRNVELLKFSGGNTPDPKFKARREEGERSRQWHRQGVLEPPFWKSKVCPQQIGLVWNVQQWRSLGVQQF